MKNTGHICKTAAAMVLLAAFCATQAMAAPKKVPAASASGFFVNREGYVLTVNHGMEQCGKWNKIVIHSGNSVVEAKLVAADAPHDLALLKTTFPVVGFLNFRPLSRPFTKGEPVIASGYAGFRDLSHKTEFITREAKVTGAIKDPRGDTKLLFTSVASQGDSGGPLLDAAGNVAGMVQALLEMSAIDKTTGKKQSYNAATSLKALRRFLDANHVRYQEAPENGPPSLDRLTEISQAIVHIVFFCEAH